ncbi:hypothetical protein PMIN06_009783, partial [Paraphaeosphaeria minitans]
MGSSETTNACAVSTMHELQEALSTNVYDREGTMHALGDLIKGKRSVLVFTRHSCAQLQRIWRPRRPLLIISNGSHQPIDTYARTTSSAYPVYTDPTCRLHAMLKFKSGLKEGTVKRDYMPDTGGRVGRIVGEIKGALGNLQHTAYIGPKSLNGGEVVVGA